MGIGREWGINWRMELGGGVGMASIKSVSETTTVESVICIPISKINKKGNKSKGNKSKIIS